MLFSIEYREPTSGESKQTEAEFEDSQSPAIPARMWAEDYAYTLADKGEYTVREIGN